MRTYLAIATATAMMTGTAIAQPANRDATTPAVNSPNTPPNPGAPVAGSNSFTEGQAKSRIESNGFSNVSELRKDDQGVWRGKAMKDGKSGHGESRLSGQRHRARAARSMILRARISLARSPRSASRSATSCHLERSEFGQEPTADRKLAPHIGRVSALWGGDALRRSNTKRLRSNSPSCRGRLPPLGRRGSFCKPPPYLPLH